MADALHSPTVDGTRWHLSRLSPQWALPVLLVLVALAYWPGLRGGFVFDDYPNIIDNVRLHVGFGAGWHAWLGAMFSSPASDLQRPLAMLSFAVNHALTGLDPYWMKLTNLGIHLANSTLVFLLVRRLMGIASPAADTRRRDWIALWTAGAWALNPINLMAVLYVVQRMESLCHLFVFAGLLLYLVGRQRQISGTKGWWLVWLGLGGGMVVGLMVKESAVLLPLYALAIEWALLRCSTVHARRDNRLLVMYGMVLVVPAISGLVWLLPGILSGAAFANRGFSLWERLLTEGRVVVDYLHWTLLPDLGQLSLYHDDYTLSHGLLSPPATLASFLFLALLAGIALWLRRRRPLAALGIAWFLSAQLLTATIIPLDLVYEHRNYFASLGLCVTMADVLLLAPRTQVLRRTGVAVAVLVLAAYAGLTALRAHEWDNPLRFSLLEASKHPQSPRATYELARNYVVLSSLDADPATINRAFAALRRAMAVPDATPLPEAAAITLAARLGQPIEPAWWESLQNKLRSRPINPQETGALSTLVSCQISSQCDLPRDAMIGTFLAALSKGEHAEVMNIYGNYALNILHDPRLALALWKGAASRAPRVPEYQSSVARLLIAQGRPQLAAPYIARIRQIGHLGQNEAMARSIELLVEASRDPAGNQPVTPSH